MHLQLLGVPLHDHLVTVVEVFGEIAEVSLATAAKVSGQDSLPGAVANKRTGRRSTFGVGKVFEHILLHDVEESLGDRLTVPPTLGLVGFPESQ